MEAGDALNAQPALRLRDIRKTFPGVVAVDGVDLDLFAGEIHALVGENGAGKSTLANIAFGALRPDSGSVECDGVVGLVHQHFELVGRLRIWQNILLGREPRAGWQIDVAAARERVRTLAAANGLDIDSDAMVDELPIGIQQRVELLRELDRNPSVLLLDEPTAALAPAEIASFFATITDLAKRGTAILIITHKLQEVIDYSARTTVMRAGKIVASMPTAQTTAAEISRAMVGGNVPELAARAHTVPSRRLVVTNLRTGNASNAVRDICFEVGSGEIVGIAGVEGNGQTALADALCGLVEYEGSISGNDGLAVIPQDRQREALLMNASIVSNVILGRQKNPRLNHRGVLDRAAALADASAIIERFDVRAASADVTVRTLSGGNQQKVVVGRALIDSPPVVLAYQPTRGVDVGAAALLQSRLIDARNAGAAVLLISFELDEILALSDRVLVMFRGSIAGEFSGERIDRARIGALMAGGQ